MGADAPFSFEQEHVDYNTPGYANQDACQRHTNSNQCELEVTDFIVVVFHIATLFAVNASDSMQMAL